MKAAVSLAVAGVAFALLLPSARADTLYFKGTSGNILWSSLGNWYLSDGMGGFVPAGHLPLATDNAIVTSTADAQATGIQLNTLILQPFVPINNGAFTVQTLQMGFNSSFTGSVITIDSQMDVLGSGCGLSSVTLTINPGAFLLMSVSGASLFLSGGVVINNEGQVVLTDKTAINCSGPGTNKFENRSGATVSSSGSASISGTSGITVFDNSGTVKADSGTLTFTGLPPGLSWSCSNNTGIFNPAASNATIVLDSPLNVDPGVTFLFTGPGTNVIEAGATVRGTVQVGAVDSGTGLFDPGNLATATGGGQIQGAGAIHVLASNSVASTLTFSNALINATTITIDAGAWLDFIGGGSMLSNVVNNAGTTVLTGNFDLMPGGGATFNNLAGATFIDSGDGGFVGGGGNAVFNNAGTFRKTAGINGTTLAGPYPGVFFNNTGLLDVQTGSVDLFNGAGSGQFNAAAGTAIMFGGGTNIVNSGATFTGGGMFQLNGGYHPVFFLNGDVSMPNLEVDNNNTIDGPGQLTVNGPFVCNGAIIQGNGKVNIPVGATMSIIGSLGLDQRTINNSGTVIWTNGGGITANDGAVFNNLSGALFDMRSDAQFGFGLVGTRPAFNNFGTVRKSAGSSTSYIFVNFNNSGLFQVLTQTVYFNPACQQTAGSTIVSSNAAISGTGLNIQGGTLAGSGSINCPLTNSGTVSPGMSPGILTIGGGGNNYVQSVNGILNIELGGLTAGTQYDQLASGGPVNLNGELNVSLVNGFVPSPGQQFTILTCASRTGTFPVKNGAYLGNNLALVPVYSNTSVVLVVSNVTVIQPLISIADTGNNAQLTWPSIIGQPYQVEYSSDLAQWFVLSNLTASSASTIMLDPTPTSGVPKRFYRLR